MSAAAGAQTLQDRALRAIVRAIETVNRSRAVSLRVATSPETILWGAGGVLDSLGLVNLIVAVEEEVAEEFGRPVNLADERMRVQGSSPLATIGSLAAYVTSLLGA